MSSNVDKKDNDSFPEEHELDEKSKMESLDSSEQEEDADIDEEEETLHDLMCDFFLNENGDNIATILTNIQTSIEQNSKCILKLTKVLQDIAASQAKK